MMNAMWIALVIGSVVPAHGTVAGVSVASSETDAAAVGRVDVSAARQMVKDGKATLVCAYDSDEKFAKVHLEGAISRSEFTKRLPTLPKDTVLIFYCA